MIDVVRLDDDERTTSVRCEQWRSRPVLPSCPLWIFQLAGPGRAGPGCEHAFSRYRQLTAWVGSSVACPRIYKTGKLLTWHRFYVSQTNTQFVLSPRTSPCSCCNRVRTTLKHSPSTRFRL